MEHDAHLQPGVELRDRWEVKERLDKGRFGQLYVAFDKELAKDVAIKTEARAEKPTGEYDGNVRELLYGMRKNLEEVEGSPHFCTMIGYGEDPAYNFLVITLCGPNLKDLRLESPHRYLSFGTAAQITIQMVEALETFHNKTGYLHRNIKPSSMVIGKGENSRIAYLVGLGCRLPHIKWITDENGNRIGHWRRVCREPMGLADTVPYDSLNVHRYLDKGRRDDLWSLFYVFVEMTVGRLPWSGKTGRSKVMDIKKRVENNELIKGMPDSLQDMLSHLESLGPLDLPNYDHIKDCSRNAMRSLDIPPDEPFDWEDGYIKCQDNCPFVSPKISPLAD